MRSVPMLMCLLLGGCFGTISDPGGTDDSAPQSPQDDVPLPRLSHDEYVQTIRDLIQEVAPDAADQVLAAIEPLLDGMPQDQLVGEVSEQHGGFSRLDQTEQQEYADVPFNVAIALGDELTANRARLAEVVGDCAADEVSAGCLEDFVRRFGEIAQRRPLEDDDVAFYAGTGPATAAEVGQIIAVILSSPRALYHVESGTKSVGDSTFALDDWELASRLSYHLWGTMPDARLRDAARAGRLVGDYEAVVDEMLADPRTARTQRLFFEQWLWPTLELPALDSRVSDPQYQAFAGDDLPGPELRRRMVDEVLDAAIHVSSQGGSFNDLLTNRQSFARDEDLAAIYGVDVWDGEGEPPALPAERTGLLTRAAFLATGTANTRPIMKGVFIRTSLLCDSIAPPPPEAANTPIVVEPGQTTREVIEQLTQQQGSVCAGCHQTLINPLGFASENFDGLGRFRTAQLFFDEDGEPQGEREVDTTTVPAVSAGDSAVSTGMADLTQLIATSDKPARCLAERYFRFAYRRLETAKDERVLDELASRIRTDSLASLFKAAVLRPEFQQRRIVR